MHFPILTLTLFALSSVITASTLGDITETSHRIADATDTQQYDKLDAVMTRDVIIDATALQPFTGGVLRGREPVKARFRQAGAGAKTVHRVCCAVGLFETLQRKMRFLLVGWEWMLI